ncbi:MAG: hypothetical protein M3342_19825 [Bacteroidota bacterium]|nr:hypothetical protein [Bacteroidota bacterium]
MATNIQLDEDKLKDLLKSAFSEVLEKHRDVLQDIIKEASEDNTSKTRRLHILAIINGIFLTVISIIAFLFGLYFLKESENTTSGSLQEIESILSEPLTWAIALIGLSGSGVAALTSCLDRYAKGFELESGRKIPRKAEGEVFNKRMSLWFFCRPFLGFIVAPVFTWCIGSLFKGPTGYTGSVVQLGVIAFLGGLLAKSVIELFKNLFKNIFKK